MALFRHVAQAQTGFRDLGQWVGSDTRPPMAWDSGLVCSSASRHCFGLHLFLPLPPPGLDQKYGADGSRPVRIFFFLLRLL